MVRRFRWLIVSLAVLLVVTGCTAGGSTSSDEATPTPIPTPIVPTKPTYEVKRGEVVDSVEFTGRIAPVVEQEIYFRTSGYVDVVNVKRDDWVKEGDVLAELEVTDLKNQLLQAEASLESVISSNAQRLAEAEARLRTAELQLAITKASNPAPQVTIAEVALERAQTTLADAEEEYDKAIHRYWEKQEVHDAYARALREAQLDLQVAEANHEQVLQANQVYVYEVEIREQDVTLADLQLQQLKSGLDVEEIRLTVERLRAQLSDARLIAPFDGQVLTVSTSEGRAVEGYRPLMVVADPDELEVSADLTSSYLGDLAEGLPATCTVANRPGEEINGTVRRLPYPYGGGGRTGTIEEEDTSTRVSLESTPEELGLEIGDLVRVMVVLERKDDVLWLPPQAIRTFEGRKFVVIQDGEAQRRVDVKVGIASEDRVEVEEGLTEGQIVIGQ